MRLVDIPRGWRFGLAAALTLVATTHAASVRADDLPPTGPPLPALPPAQAPTVVVLESPGDPPTAEEPRDRPKRASGFAGRVHGGLGRRSLFRDSLLGADLTASLGGYVDNVCIYADLQLMLGSDNGLDFRQYRVGPSLDVEVISRLRLGAGLSVGGTTLARATNGETMDAWSWGARALASVDLFQLEGRTALYLLGELSVDSVGTFLGSDTRQGVPIRWMWGPTIAAGVRF